jgi:hypothetical protein
MKNMHMVVYNTLNPRYTSILDTLTGLSVVLLKLMLEPTMDVCMNLCNS